MNLQRTLGGRALAYMTRLSIWTCVLVLLAGFILGIQGCSDDLEDLIPCELDAECEPNDPDPVVPSPTPEPTNPSCPEVTKFGGDGSVWKPKSESTGRLVVILPSRYPVPFVCSAKLKTGGEEVLSYSGLANGGRQHHRGSLAGGKYENDGTVTCMDSGQRCLFRFQGKARDRHG